MMELNGFINDFKISEIVYFGDISNTFKNTIKVNNDFEDTIINAYNEIILDYAKVYLNRFYLIFLKMFDDLAGYHGIDDEDLIEFSQSLTTIIIPYFEKLSENLEIKSTDDLEELGCIFEIALILMEETIEYKNFDLAYEVFFQITRRVENKKLYNESVRLI